MLKWHRRTLRHAIIVCAATALSPAAAQQSAATCFDAVVRARVVRQVPTAYPDCGADCIVMTWPWFVDIDVGEVLRGKAATGPLRMISLLHVRYVQDRALRMILRRNALGGWNQLRIEERGLRRCAAGAPPARPYVRPEPGQTMNDLFRQSVAEWDGRH